MFGNAEEAEIIGEWDMLSDPIPEGFEYFNEGAQRIVVRGQSGILYKRDNGGEPDANLMEFDNYNFCSVVPIKGWRVPQTGLFVIGGYQPVIAMECVIGYRDVHCDRFKFGYIAYNEDCTCELDPCSAHEWEKPMSLWYIQDLSYENVLIEDDGTRVLVDMVS